VGKGRMVLLLLLREGTVDGRRKIRRVRVLEADCNLWGERSQPNNLYTADLHNLPALPSAPPLMYKLQSASSTGH
jgi:hypothetical protein